MSIFAKFAVGDSHHINGIARQIGQDLGILHSGGAGPGGGSNGSMGGRGPQFADQTAADLALDPITEANRIAQEIAAQNQRDFEQASAREAMTFEADQAQINRDFQAASAREAMAFEADQAQINRDWQAEMSNTAYQRAVADLKAAGLNPALAYQQGGAATTSGATASGHVASGSSASGFSAHGTKADVDTTTLVELYKSTLNVATSALSSVLRVLG